MIVEFHQDLFDVETYGPAKIIHLQMVEWGSEDSSPVEGNVPQVETCVQEIQKNINYSEPIVILNFSQVQVYHSSGMTPLVKLAMFVRERGGVLNICCLPPSMQDVVEVSRLDRVVRVFDNEIDAMRTALLPEEQGDPN